MLTLLQVRNLAVVEDVRVAFEDGMTALTGETGAGKSMLVGALKLLLGERAQTDLIRAGEESARVEAVFELPPRHPVHALLVAAGIEDGEELTLVREISAKGRSRAFANHSPVTATLLEQLTSPLITIVSQHEHTRLHEAESQRALLDGAAGHAGLLEEVAGRFHTYDELLKRLDGFTRNNDARLARVDYLRFQIEEFDRVNPQEGEEEELTAQRHRLMNLERLREAVSGALMALADGEQNAEGLAGHALNVLARGERYEERFGEFTKALSDALSILSDTVSSLRHYEAGLEADPTALERVEERLQALHRLARKHGGSMEGVFAAVKGLREELAKLDGDGEDVEGLRQRVGAALGDYRMVAARLSASRRAAAEKLGVAVTASARELGMPHARFHVVVEDAPASARGSDRVVLMFSANPDGALMPLGDVASGGELSRVMLALRAVAHEGSEHTTLVFDEADAGIGGAVAEVVGRKMALLARHRQVLTITHLAQIAARADHQFRIEKQIVGGRTRTTVSGLDLAGREQEVARMLGGVEIGPAALAHAREMLTAPARDDTPPEIVEAQTSAERNENEAKPSRRATRVGARR